MLLAELGENIPFGSRLDVLSESEQIRGKFLFSHEVQKAIAVIDAFVQLESRQVHVVHATITFVLEVTVILHTGCLRHARKGSLPL